MSSARSRPLSPRPAALPALALGLGAGALGVAALVAALAPAPGLADTALALAAFAVAGAILLATLPAYPHARLGLCNAVTLARLTMTCAVAGLVAAPGVLADPATGWAVTGLCALALALDGVDGWAARRSGLASDWGARFDMETDAFLGAVLSVLVWQTGKAGLWVLALGFMRFAWIVAGRALPWLNGDLPPSLRRKAVCVIQIAALIALISPALAPPLSQGVAAVAVAVLGWSFAVDGLWLLRRRA
ncbi:MAG TPA: CDP-alcohol phosphatidyltransferase family protein [Paracoccaceae bacterium]|nr:CDP-alcohol phosphatidyltransferase family protein [Paracoccaceae bacterium]